MGGLTISHGEPVNVIAEIGVNHNGDPDMAVRMIDAAKQAGADCVKFQTFLAEEVVTAGAAKAAYQYKTTANNESQFEMLKKLELPQEAYPAILRACREKEVTFLSTPYSLRDVEYLESIGVEGYKIASALAVEPVMLAAVAKLGKPILLSTGMCTLAEVAEAMQIIRDHGNDKIVLLQCTTDYPSRLDECNLRAMLRMGEAFDVVYGYSDHTEGFTATMTAVALGAAVIERHFTLDKRMPGPDHSSSSTPQEFREMIGRIRAVEQCLGQRHKAPTKSEIVNATNMRRGIYCISQIKQGEEFSLENIGVRRPPHALDAKSLPLLLGRRANQDIAPGEKITFAMIGEIF